MVNDWKFAWRQLQRSPGFALAAVLCLALGIGATSAIFSVVNAVVLRPLPYAEAERLVRLYSEWPTWPNGGMWKFWISPPEFRAIERDNRVFASVDAWQSTGINLAPNGREPVRVNATQVSGGLMRALGVAPLKGRWLEAADDKEGAALSVVISYGLWQGAFGGEDSAVGRQVQVNGRAATVAGVMPRGFEFPPGEALPAEMWAPLQLTSVDLTRWDNHRLYLLARMKPGLTLAQANQDLNRLERDFEAQGSPGAHRPNTKTHTLNGFPLLEETVGNVRPAMLLMLGATALVLLIACGNVANLLLARAQARQREVAVRQAIGASLGDLLRQFLLEGLMLSVGASVVGLALAYFLLRMILRLGAESIPRAAEVRMDGAVLLVATLAALVTGVVFAFAPLAQTVRTRLFDTLKSAGSRSTATREAHWLRNLLVTGEIALALMLLAGAGLLIESFWKLMRTDPGVRPEGVLTMRVVLPQQNYPQANDTQRFWRETLTRVGALPGVKGVGLLAGLPPQRPINANDTYIEGLVAKPEGPFHNVDYWNVAAPGTFELLGMPLVRGRLFDSRDGDGAPLALVVNERFEKTFYGGQSAIGRRVKPGGSPQDKDPWCTIVGVVRDAKNQGLDRPAGTELFFPIGQAGAMRGASLLVKTAAGDPWATLAPVRDAIRSIDATLPLSQVRPLEEAISVSRARPRFLAVLLALFALVALGLATTGIFGVMSYMVAQRTNEFGLRMALGASAGQVLALVFQHGGRLVLSGVVCGVAGAWALARALRGAVNGLEELHWLPVMVTIALLAAVTMAACWTPARRATRVDPAEALRVD